MFVITTATSGMRKLLSRMIGNDTDEHYDADGMPFSLKRPKIQTLRLSEQGTLSGTERPFW
ncbi:hypothetical protein CVS28_14380 [Arthrobacter glacialis]|nr:hypothetical protein CVS28_14380 [Arthrobacter glacialis]